MRISFTGRAEKWLLEQASIQHKSPAQIIHTILEDYIQAPTQTVDTSQKEEKHNVQVRQGIPTA
jgi:hypothetical protein